MPKILSFAYGDELPNASAGFTIADGSWWEGVGQAVTTIALATVLAASSLGAQVANAAGNQHQDDPSGNLTATADENYRIEPVRPFVADYVLPQTWTFDEQIPAGNLRAPADEQYELLPNLQAQYPVPQTFSDDVVIVPQPIAFNPDQDYWINPIIQQQFFPVQTVYYLFDSSEIVPQPVVGGFLPRLMLLGSG